VRSGPQKDIGADERTVDGKKGSGEDGVS